MKAELERLHKILGSVCGQICIALTIRRVAGGEMTIRHWTQLTRQALEILERMEKS